MMHKLTQLNRTLHLILNHLYIQCISDSSVFTHLNVKNTVKLSCTHLSAHSFCVLPVCSIKITMILSHCVFVSSRNMNILILLFYR